MGLFCLTDYCPLVLIRLASVLKAHLRRQAESCVDQVRGMIKRLEKPAFEVT